MKWGRYNFYGQRNAMFLQGEKLPSFLDNGFGLLWKATREEKTGKYAGLLAGVFARTVAYSQSFRDLQMISGAMAAKYPLGGCNYCNALPCSCSSGRRSATTHDNKSSSGNPQLLWTISQCVEHVRHMYGKINQGKCIYFACLRLNEEIGEVKNAHLFDGYWDNKVYLGTRRWSIALEFADVFAWIFSIADIIEVDLEKEIRDRYGGVCKRCEKRPCKCNSPEMYENRSRTVETRLSGS